MRTVRLRVGDRPSGGGVSALDTTLISTTDALARPNLITVTDSNRTTQYANGSPGDDATFDFRGLTSTAFPFGHLYALNIGTGTKPARVVIVGGTVLGQQSRDILWGQDYNGVETVSMKSNYDGTGLLLRTTDWAVLDGMHMYNVMDAWRPQPVEQVVARNCWGQGTRDDEFENDGTLPGGLFWDNLHEGCHVWLSQQESTAVWQGFTLNINHVIARMEPQAYSLDNTGDPPFGVDASGDPETSPAILSGKGHAQQFKFFDTGDAPINVKNFMLLVQQPSLNGYSTMNIPTVNGSVYENCLLIYLGDGVDAAWPGTNALPAGWTLLDRTVTNPSTGNPYTRSELFAIYATARDEWYTRHGITGTTDGEGSIDMATATKDPVKRISPDDFPHANWPIPESLVA